jgi:hypothetical protein
MRGQGFSAIVGVFPHPPPLALSLSKGMLAWLQGFDRLSPNGQGGVSGKPTHPDKKPLLVLMHAAP